MKSLLLTWYGITDFRASLSNEDIIGPILGALLSQDYNEVLIMGYTNINQKYAQNEFNGDYLRLVNNQITLRDFIGIYANSLQAHTHFVNWLREQLSEYDRKTTVDFRAIKLDHLNDTQSIYEACMCMMKEVAVSTDDIIVTLYLSPGTPVMAFVWTLIALQFPQVQKRLIASSNPELPPENITLPMEWLEWHGKRLKISQSDFKEYDVILHLYGEQKMPAFLGICQFECDKHVFITSPRYPADHMKNFVEDQNYYEIIVNPFNPEDVRSKVDTYISSLPNDCKIGFNLTGGTKLMYAGALSACRKVNATPFYFNDYSHQVIYLNDFHTEDIKPIHCIEPYINISANELIVSNSGKWKNVDGINDFKRQELTRLLWIKRKTIVSLYNNLCDGNYNIKPGVNFEFSTKNEDIKVSLQNNKHAKAIIKTYQGNCIFEFNDWPDFAKYLSGGWFEEYTYLKLMPLVDDGIIKDIRIGYRVALNDGVNSKEPFKTNQTYQEFDIILTDGSRLYIIECKSGNTVVGEYVNKLESITRYFGGVMAKGILLVCKDDIHKVVRKKVEQSHNVALFDGEYLFEQLTAYFYKG